MQANILNCDIPFHLASYNDNNQIKSLYRYNHLAPKLSEL